LDWILKKSRRRRRHDRGHKAIGEARPELPLDIVISHVLKEEHLSDPADLAVLRAVSKGMRDAVDATGRHIRYVGDLERAASRGWLRMIVCMVRRGGPDYYVIGYPKLFCQAAASCGQLKILKLFRKSDLIMDERTCVGAARGGHFEVLKWAHAKLGLIYGTYMRKGSETCAGAAEGGHLKILKWAHENGYPWDKETCTDAARGGHFEVLKWAHENGCPWDESTCWAAAEGGHLDVLKWARENGCPWDEWTCRGAAKGGHLDVLKWARENGCP
jgi:hypothetical protein